MSAACTMQFGSRSAHRLDDPNKVRTADVLNVENDKKQFSDLHFPEKILTGLNNAGFLRPSPVQWSALPLAKIGVDLIVQSKSGTGKTLVYVVTALNMVDTSVSAVQAVILTPTREIAVQGARISLDIAAFAMPDLKVSALIGGMSLQDDAAKLKRCHIVVGTPGRIRQLIDEKYFKTEAIRFFALDEADKMLESSFKNDVTWIYNQLPSMKQVMALSATYPESLASTISSFMRAPKHVRLDPSSQVLLGLDQYVLHTSYHPKPRYQLDVKFRVLLDILNSITFSQCLIFTNYSLSAQTICERLNGNGWPAIYIAANLQNQYERLNALNSLRQFTTRIMVTTDLSARGVDAANVTLVVNFDVPWDSRTFLHRSGRAGRFGSRGINLTLASEGDEANMLRKIVFRTGTKIKIVPYETSEPNKEKEDQDKKIDYELPDLWKLDTGQAKTEIEKYKLMVGLECPVEDLEDEEKYHNDKHENKNEQKEDDKKKRKGNRRKKKKGHSSEKRKDLSPDRVEETPADKLGIDEYKYESSFYLNENTQYNNQEMGPNLAHGVSVYEQDLNYEYDAEDYYEYGDEYDEEYYDEDYYDEDHYGENENYGEKVYKGGYENHEFDGKGTEPPFCADIKSEAVLFNDISAEYSGEEEQFLITQYSRATGYTPIESVRETGTVQDCLNQKNFIEAKELLFKYLKSESAKKTDHNPKKVYNYKEIEKFAAKIENNERLDLCTKKLPENTGNSKSQPNNEQLINAANTIKQFEHDKWESNVKDIIQQIKKSNISVPTMIDEMLNGNNISDMLNSERVARHEEATVINEIEKDVGDRQGKTIAGSVITNVTDDANFIDQSADVVRSVKLNPQVSHNKQHSKSLKTEKKTTEKQADMNIGPDGLPKWVPVEDCIDDKDEETSNHASFQEVYRQGKNSGWTGGLGGGGIAYLY